MGDKKLTQLPVVTSPLDDDLLYLVHGTGKQSSAVKWSTLGSGGGGGGGGLSGSGIDWAETTIAKVQGSRAATLILTANGKLYAARGHQHTDQIGLMENSQHCPMWGIGSYITRVHIPHDYEDDYVVDMQMVNWTSYVMDNRGNLFVCGYNGNGQLGFGNTSNYTKVFRKASLPAGKKCDTLFGIADGQSKNSYSQALMFIRTEDLSSGAKEIYGVGFNSYHNLGLGDTTRRTVWTHIGALDGIASKIVNINHGTSDDPSILWTTDNEIWGCGNTAYYELGKGTTTNVTTWENLTSYWNPSGWDVEKIICGDYSGTSNVHVCFQDGTDVVVKAAGYNAHGQIGAGTTSTVTTPTEVFRQPGTLIDFKVEGGISTAILIYNSSLLKNVLYKTGYNGLRIIGNGLSTNVKVYTSIAISGGSVNPVKLLTSEEGSENYPHYTNSFVLGDDDYIYASGYHAYGMGGTGTGASYLEYYTKVLIPPHIAKNITKINEMDTVSGAKAYFAISNVNGKMYVWGWNGNYCLFDRYSYNQEVPVPATTITAVMNGWL